MSKYGKLLIGPLCILGLILLIDFSWTLLNLPSEKELIPIIKTYFDSYGILIVFLAAIFESAFVLGVYAPGGLVIFLGVIFSIGNPWKAVFVVASVITGFLIGFTIDFYLGRYGWYKFLIHFGLQKTLDSTKEKIEKYGQSTAWVAYHHPDLGSLVATSYGILQFSYKKFMTISVLPVTLWCIFWGTLAYFLGEKALQIMGYKTLFIILGVWIIARIIEVKILEKKVE